MLHADEGRRAAVRHLDVLEDLALDAGRLDVGDRQLVDVMFPREVDPERLHRVGGALDARRELLGRPLGRTTRDRPSSACGSGRPKAVWESKNQRGF